MSDASTVEDGFDLDVEEIRFEVNKSFKEIYEDDNTYKQLKTLFEQLEVLCHHNVDIAKYSEWLVGITEQLKVSVENLKTTLQYDMRNNQNKANVQAMMVDVISKIQVLQFDKKSYVEYAVSFGKIVKLSKAQRCAVVDAALNPIIDFSQIAVDALIRQLNHTKQVKIVLEDAKKRAININNDIADKMKTFVSLFDDLDILNRDNGRLMEEKANMIQDIGKPK